MIVDGVTKLKKVKYKSKKENQAENLRKMILAMSDDIRVILVKLADRLHNMRTLNFMPRNKQIEIALETLEIYAPIAHRLGISAVKTEIEDLSLKYMEPEIYEDIKRKLAIKTQEREKPIENIINKLKLALDEIHIKAEFSGRSKSIFSIYKKMYRQERAFEQIFDLVGIRIIVDTVKDCYTALGIVHNLYKPIPGRFKDYIAMPKINLYQSLHTTVIGDNGEIFEVQIRTHEMHSIAEYGIAAHWKYKEGTNKKDSFDEKLSWLRQIMDWQKDLSDSREFIDAFREDFLVDEVFVFSPKGEVINLPEGSVPIDFAYRVHTAVGNNCIGAKVDGRIVPLNYKLKNGNIVEILTSTNNSGPSRDWLKIVKSNQARSKIRQWFKKEERDLNIVKGRTSLEREVRRLGYRFNEILKEDWLKEVSKKLKFSSVDDMYASLGYGSIQLNQIVQKLIVLHKDYYKVEDAIDNITNKTQTQKRRSKTSHGVYVKGIENIEIKLAGCCTPVPGDKIIGYITRGRGISVHRVDCSNIVNNKSPERFMDVYWDEEENSSYAVELKILALDRVGYLVNLTTAITDSNISLNGINARSNKDKTFSINVILQIDSIDQLNSIISKIRALKGTIDVYRVKS